MSYRTDSTSWPDRLRPAALRFGRASRHYEEAVAFYRDLVGLPVVDQFTASFGEDGTIFGLPDTSVQLELVRARERSVNAVFDQLVLYFKNAAAVTDATASLRAAGHLPTPDQHPYWAANGAATFRDPDGREVVFVPWVYGREPEAAGDAGLRVEQYHGERSALRPLFEEAEDSEEQLSAYIDDGDVLAAWHGPRLVGHLQLVRVDEDTIELKNMAVVPELRGTGVGRALITAAVAMAGRNGASRMLVATGAADVGNLRFYQRCGFRFLAVERDAFTPQAGYPEQILIDGIALLDRIWLDRPLTHDPQHHNSSHKHGVD